MAQKISRRVALVLFMARLYREGKLEKFWERKKQIKGEFGAGGQAGSNALVREFGYISPTDEWEREQALRFLPRHNRQNQAQVESVKSRGRSAIANALMELQPVASVEQEMAWVRSHPKMTVALTRKLTQSADEEYKPPSLTVADLSDVVPPCPSRSAWNVLLSALGDPKKFNDVLLTKQKDAVSKTSEAGSTETVGHVDDDLEEVERMLAKAVSLDG